MLLQLQCVRFSIYGLDQGRPSHGRNETEIFIVAILVGKKAILGEGTNKVSVHYTPAPRAET